MKRYLNRAAVAFGLGVALAVTAGGCSKGDSGEVHDNVLTDSLAASAKLRSYEVQVDGEVAQGSRQAKFKVTYQFVSPDKLQWIDESTSGGATEKTGAVVVGKQWWSLEGDTWQDQGAAPSDLALFSVERLYRLIPFDTATSKKALETAGPFKARHFTISKSGTLSLELLAGSLIASDDPGFDGNITDFKIDYWTEESQGFPVKMKLVATGDGGRKLTLNAQMTKANDDSIQVKAPESFLPARSSSRAVPASTAVNSAPRPTNTSSPAAGSSAATAATTAPPAGASQPAAGAASASAAATAAPAAPSQPAPGAASASASTTAVPAAPAQAAPAASSAQPPPGAVAAVAGATNAGAQPQQAPTSPTSGSIAPAGSLVRAGSGGYVSAGPNVQVLSLGVVLMAGGGAMLFQASRPSGRRRRQAAPSANRRR